MTDEIARAARFAVQKYERLLRQRSICESLQATQDDLAVSTSGLRHADLMFQGAMEALCGAVKSDTDT